jgi:hypothetical protein
LLGAFAVLVIMTSTGQPGARAASSGGTTIGPVQISALGHPGLCWQAGGNGSGVSLERCDRVLQGQQWSLTPDGVLMNGNGYCLEAVPGSPLLVDFASQCAGTPSQRWHSRSGRLVSPVTGSATGTSAAGPAAPAGAAPAEAAPAEAAAGTCAVTTAPVVPGAEIVGAACPRPHAVSSSRRPDAISPRAASRWSIGYSAVSLTASRGQGSIGGMFGASVTVANAASAQAAYGVSVTFALPPGVAASSLHATPGSGSPGPGPSGSGLHCDVSTLTCTGTVPAGASGRITLTGPVPAAVRPGDSYPVRARASVTGTIQRSRTAGTTASLSITVSPAASHPRSPLPLIAAGAALLLLAGLALLLITRRGRLDQPVAALRISP